MSYLGTVHIEPPITDEVLLVEKSSIGAEEAVLQQTRISIIGTNVESLAVRLWVCIVPFDLIITEECSLWGVHKDGIVLARNTRDILGKCLKWVFLSIGK